MPETRTLITFDDAVARLTEAVESRPADYVNAVKHVTPGGYEEWKTCQYLADSGDEPSCIIGTAFFAELTEAGLTDPEHEANKVPVGTLFGNGSRTGVMSLAGYDVTDKALAFMSAAQTKQDTGGTWVEALAAGHRRVASVDFDDTEPCTDPTYFG